jgi:hypothetical protein
MVLTLLKRTSGFQNESDVVAKVATASSDQDFTGSHLEIKKIKLTFRRKLSICTVS